MPKFRKKTHTGRHVFRVKGRRITMVPGGTIVCDEKDLQPFADEYELLSPKVEEEIVEEEATDEVAGLQMVSKGHGWYDVINPENPDKPLNEKSLKKTQAEAFISGDTVIGKKRRRK